MKKIIAALISGLACASFNPSALAAVHIEKNK
jgi:hypothetical protein